MKKKFVLIVLVLLILSTAFIPKNIMTIYNAQTELPNCKASVLIERSTGNILAENNCHEHLPIASVTKLMTVLLTLEEVNAGRLSLDDYIIVSENASGMGGSQVFIDANGKYKIGELLKSVIVASANDSSVALAEHLAGSENNFVRRMNERANELNLKDTNYVNCTGLPSVGAYSSAYDQAVLLNEVLKHDTYHKYSSIWMEDFVHPSGRITQMTNTNRLSRFYEGCIGGKTGSTNEAKYCLAVGAEKQNMGLIAVVLGADNSKERFSIASNLLDYGFAEYETKTIFNNSCLLNRDIKIKGQDRFTPIVAEREYSTVVKKGEELNYNINYNLPNKLISSVQGEIVGNAEIVINGVVVERINLLATATHNEATIWDYIKEIARN